MTATLTNAVPPTKLPSRHGYLYDGAHYPVRNDSLVFVGSFAMPQTGERGYVDVYTDDTGLVVSFYGPKGVTPLRGPVAVSYALNQRDFHDNGSIDLQTISDGALWLAGHMVNEFKRVHGRRV